MGDMGLESAFGNASMADQIRQRIKDQIEAEQRARDAAQQQFQNNRLTANDKLQAEEHAAKMQDYRDSLAQRAQGERDTAAGKALPNIGIGSAVEAPDFAKTFAGTSSAPNFTPERTLPSTQNTGGVPLDPSQPSVQKTTESPRMITGRMVSMGTEAQRTGEEKKALVGRLMQNPNLTDLQKTAFEAENAGLKVPANGFEPKPAGDTAAGDDRRFESIMTSQNLKRPVTPEDMAWANAYKTRKTLGPALSSGAADSRLASQQDFAQKEAGRKVLTDKVETPYIEAQQKADVIRNVVQSAQSGNMMAGSLQPLLATLGVVTMEGVKRINNVELNQVAGAGSLKDRILGAIGKQVDGQPMDPKLQQDLVSLANLLEKSARQKYVQGHKQIAARYGLTDETPMPEGGAAPAAGGGKRVVYDINGNVVK